LVLLVMRSLGVFMLSPVLSVVTGVGHRPARMTGRPTWDIPTAGARVNPFVTT
jgi:hypothetical protein